MRGKNHSHGMFLLDKPNFTFCTRGNGEVKVSLHEKHPISNDINSKKIATTDAKSMN